MLEGMPVLLCWRFHSFGGLEVSLLHCFDATRCLVSNKLEFAQFGAHLQKLWQFWFYCFPLLSSLQNEGLLVLLIWGMR